MKRILQFFCLIISLVIFSFSFAGCSRRKDFFVEYLLFGESIEKSFFNSGEKIQGLPFHQNDDYEIIGWFDSSTGEEILIGSAVVSDMVVVARTAKTITKTSVNWLSKDFLESLQKHHKISVVTDTKDVLSSEDFSLLGTLGSAEFNFLNSHVFNNIFPEYAFEDNLSIRAIVLPASIVGIGRNAFSGCENLAHISFNSLLTEIGKEAFLGCNSIENIILPPSLQNIGERAFAQCEKLSELSLGKKLVEISRDFVDGCKNLSSINVESSSEKFFTHEGILYRIDYGVSGGSDTITYVLIRCPEGRSLDVKMYEKTSIVDEKSFLNCKNVKKVVLNSSDATRGNEIRESAFEGCINLLEVVFSPSLSEIGNRAFFGCEFLNICDFSASEVLSAVGDFAFYNCGRLESVILPNSVENIGNFAFFGCDRLSVVKFGSSLTKANLSIGEYAFFRNTYYTDMNVFVVGQTTPIMLGKLCFGKALALKEVSHEFINLNRVKFFVPALSMSIYIERYSGSYANFENIITSE